MMVLSSSTPSPASWRSTDLPASRAMARTWRTERANRVPMRTSRERVISPRSPHVSRCTWAASSRTARTRAASWLCTSPTSAETSETRRDRMLKSSYRSNSSSSKSWAKAPPTGADGGAAGGAPAPPPVRAPDRAGSAVYSYLPSKVRTAWAMRERLQSRSSPTRSSWLRCSSMRERATTSSPTRFIRESRRSTATRMLTRGVPAGARAGARSASSAVRTGAATIGATRARTAGAGTATVGTCSTSAAAGLMSSASRPIARSTAASRPRGRWGAASMRRMASALASIASTVPGANGRRPSRRATSRSSTRCANSPMARHPTVKAAPLRV